MASDAEHLFICLWAFCMSSLEKYNSNSMEFPQENKNGTAFQPDNSIAGIILQEPWNTNSKEPMHPNVRSSTIYKNQVLEAT